MRIPIRNKNDRALTLFIELTCDQFEIPVGGEAIVRLDDGHAHSIDIEQDWVTVWDEGNNCSVEIISSDDKRTDDALRLASAWLHRMGAESEAALIGRSVERLEIDEGYLASRQHVFAEFYDGLASEDGVYRAIARSASDRRQDLHDCFLAGMTAGRLNRVARDANSFPEIGAAPFDTDTARSAFNRALANDS